MSFNSLQEVFDAFSHLKVLVIGDSMVDTYLTGKVERMSPEAAVPILNVQQESHRLGGAANVALNLQSLGANVTLATVIGNDRVGKMFCELMSQEGLDPAHTIAIPDRPTTQKKRVMSGASHLLRMDYEDDSLISPEHSRSFLAQAVEMSSTIDLLVIEDYDKGLLNKQLIDDLLTAARQADIPVCVDPKFRNFDHYQSVDFLKPNLIEFQKALGIFDSVPSGEYGKLLRDLRARLHVRDIMLTLGSQGIHYQSNRVNQLFPVKKRQVADVSGAGDTVMAIASLAFTLGLEPEFIAELSNLGGGIVCESPGVVPISKPRLMEEALKALLF